MSAILIRLFGRLPIGWLQLTHSPTCFAAAIAGLAFETLRQGKPFSFEINSQTLAAVGTLEVGGNFTVDGTLFVSDQTFLRFFAGRSSGAPNHILIDVDDGVSPDAIVERLRAVFPLML